MAKDDSSNVTKKTKLVLKDEGSKFGTEVDGIRVVANSETTLARDTHSIRLGKAPDIFRLRWVSVVLTFSLAAKEYKAQDPLSTQRSRLESAGLDVKVSLLYNLDATTHVVASKRNTAKGLSALILGKYIVTERYIDAIIAAATPTDLDKEEEVSHLEEDFDKYWPLAAEYLPDKGREPNERPAQDYLPTTERRSVFEGYTFIFCDQTQLESLQPPISHGGGKALHCVVQPGSTTPEEVVRYVKTAAGEKGLGELEDGSEGKGVVVVRLTRKEKHADWAMRIDMDVAQALDHRLIEQSEFLNAILSNDASILRKPLLPEDYDKLTQNGIRTQTSFDAGGSRSSNHTSATTSTIKAKREPVVSRFKGFDDDDDDDDDDDQVVNSAPTATQNSNHSRTSASSMRNPALQKPVSSDDSADEDAPAQNTAATQNGNPRKRPAPIDDEEESIVDKLLPQHTARKRQKQANARDDDPGFAEAHDFIKPTKPRSKKPIDVKAAARERREAEEEADRDAKQNIHEILENMTVEEMKGLAVVEEVDIVQPRQRAQGNLNGAGPGWKDVWNGRKNFKKFRRKGGGERNDHRNTNRIIVSLEETKTKDYGIGEEYWLEKESEGSKRRRKGEERRTQSQSQSASNQTRNTASLPSELVMETNDTHVPETIDLDAPRTTRHQQHSTNSSSTRASQSQIMAEKLGAKNQPVPNVTLAGPRKRKKFAAAQDSDESDGGGNGESLRFTKRVRGRDA